MTSRAVRVLAFLSVTCCCLALTGADNDTDIDRSIAKHRMGTLTIQAKPNTTVRIEQLRHEFWFGAALSSRFFGPQANADASAEQYKRVFLENFNAAVTENALKWHAMEARPGHVDYSTVDAILAWTEKHDIPLRGHNIFWGVSNRVPNWQKTMSDDELRATLKNRAETIARRYRGRFAEYDLNNEMLHDNYYERRLGPEITKQMALWVKQNDPGAKLFLNDYNVLTGVELNAYVKQIRRLLDQGVPIDGIGVQGHLHGDSFDPGTLKHALDVLAQFALPIRVTEFNFPGQRSRTRGKRGIQLSPAEEEAKAKAITEYYRICFAQPAVHGILMWGFWEGANWIPVSSLFKRDWSPTPAARAYHDLVYRTWWTNWEGKTGSDGQCKTQAFFGRYRVTIGGNEQIVDFRRAEGAKTIVADRVRLTFLRTRP